MRIQMNARCVKSNSLFFFFKMGVSSSGKYSLLLYKSNCFTISFMDLNVALKNNTKGKNVEFTKSAFAES